MTEPIWYATTLPSAEAMLTPLLESLHALGGSGTVAEIEREVAGLLHLSEAQLTLMHDAHRTEFGYRLSWSRTLLKQYGLLENSVRGVWALTPAGRTIDEVDPREVARFVREWGAPGDPVTTEGDSAWRADLREVLLNLEPDAFERLFQRVLRESGFVEVTGTGRSGDGGIDGYGLVRSAEFLSFRVLFQCKRYRGSVGAAVVRDFQGAMAGRAEKGLLVTTGTFTRGAVHEATRDGAPAVDLIDGDLLIEKLKALGLGVRVTPVVVEEVAIDHDWFESL
ncbi:MAG: restriction endonuclease [Anaerolineae bacterium]